MTKTKPCSVCGKTTAGFLFGDKTLDIPICSTECEHDYIDSLDPSMREQINILRHLDHEIEVVKKLKNTMWFIAGIGLAIIVAGSWLVNTTIFIAGIFLLTSGALMTSHFESKKNKLIRLRKKIAI